MQNRAKRTPRLNHGVAVDCLCPPQIPRSGILPVPKAMVGGGNLGGDEALKLSHHEGDRCPFKGHKRAHPPSAA